MKKTWLLALIPLILCAAVLLGYRLPTYDLVPAPTELAENAMPGAVCSLAADRTKAQLTVGYTGTEDYLIVDPRERWFHVYRLEEDGWHQINNKKTLPIPSSPIGPGRQESFSFTWRQLLGSPLDAGRYQLQIFYGDSHLAPAYWYWSFVEFSID